MKELEKGDLKSVVFTGNTDKVHEYFIEKIKPFHKHFKKITYNEANKIKASKEYKECIATLKKLRNNAKKAEKELLKTEYPKYIQRKRDFYKRETGQELSDGALYNVKCSDYYNLYIRSDYKQQL